jgi:hypothetical protein
MAATHDCLLLHQKLVRAKLINKLNADDKSLPNSVEIKSKQIRILLEKFKSGKSFLFFIDGN